MQAGARLQRAPSLSGSLLCRLSLHRRLGGRRRRGRIALLGCRLPVVIHVVIQFLCQMGGGTREQLLAAACAP